MVPSATHDIIYNRCRIALIRNRYFHGCGSFPDDSGSGKDIYRDSKFFSLD